MLAIFLKCLHIWAADRGILSGTVINILLAPCAGWIMWLQDRLASQGRLLLTFQLINDSLLGPHLNLQLLIFLGRKVNGCE